MSNTLVHFPTIFQTILMDENGVVLESDNLLFDTLAPTYSDLKQIFPVLDSFFHQLKQLTGSRPSLLVQGVEQPSEQLNGIYDFAFERVSKSPVQWQLIIYDNTDYYEHLIRQQQKSHEKMIFSDIQQEHSKAIALQTSALYRQGLDRMLRLSQSNHLDKKPLDAATSRALAAHWMDWLNVNPPRTWFDNDVVKGDKYREIKQKTAQHWLIKDSESAADFEIHTVLNDLAAYFSARSDSNFIELNILYHPNMPLTKVRGNEQLVRRVLLGCIINTLKLGGFGSVSLAATPIQYTQNSCKIEFSVQVSWLPRLPKQLYNTEFPITITDQDGLPPQTFNLFARYHCLALWVAEAGSKLQIQMQPDKGFKIFFILDLEKL
jgi:hypothetical protein